LLKPSETPTSIDIDDDLTIVTYCNEMELKQKQNRAIERRRKLEEIKQKQKMRNPHLEVVPPKPLTDDHEDKVRENLINCCFATRQNV